MTKAPNTYFEWCELLDYLKNSSVDNEVLEAIDNGFIESGTYERLFKRISEIIEFRIKKSSEKFDSIVKKSSDINIISPALNNLKREFIFLIKIAKSKSILNVSKEYSDKLIDFIKNTANSMHESLEKSSVSDRTGMLKKIIVNAKINDLGV
ncbi:hypothetical protein [uncultured Brachyspira sp.]|uniref:hypothetical protein n=1 Tax=uncultured Brachyspira sp. TaxID=221953 RepID=UPI002627A0C0|nr:hypothetical protein [uncultured Brachyspira sp.]